MKAKYLISSMILMITLASGCQASFQNVDKSGLKNAGEGDGPGEGDLKPDLDPTDNPLGNGEANPNPNDPNHPIDPSNGGKDPVDPIGGKDGKLSLKVTLPSPEIKAGEEKMQAKAILSTMVDPPAVTWTITGPVGRTEIGSIDANGIYTSPKDIDKSFPILITATLKSNPTIVGTAQLTILPKDQIFARCTRGNAIFPILADVYQINGTATKLPNFANPAEARKVTTVCMDKYAVAPRNFDAGFPDVPGLFEWFALDTKTQIVIPQDGQYTFYLNSDDGSKLYIDGSLVIDNDGLHQAIGTGVDDSTTIGQKEVTIPLLKGDHDLRLEYFQGPRYRMALELKWKIPGTNNVVYVPRENFK